MTAIPFHLDAWLMFKHGIRKLKKEHLRDVNVYGFSIPEGFSSSNILRLW